MRIADHFLKEIIANNGHLRVGTIEPLGVLRLALDLREARERIAALESDLALLKAPPKKLRRQLVAVEEVTARFGDPRSSDYEEHARVVDRVGKKVDYRA